MAKQLSEHQVVEVPLSDTIFSLSVQANQNLMMCLCLEESSVKQWLNLLKHRKLMLNISCVDHSNVDGCSQTPLLQISQDSTKDRQD